MVFRHSNDGFIRAAENVEKVGAPVMNLSQKILSLLMGGDPHTFYGKLYDKEI